MPLLDSTLNSIAPVDRSYYDRAAQRLDILTKPKDSLGRLEEFARRVVAITEDTGAQITSKTIFTFAADHGVAQEGVSAFPKEVTAQMVYNFLRGGAAINVLARHAGAAVKVVDIGVDHDFKDEAGLISKKIVRGTANMRRGPAMSRREAVDCIEAGIAIAHENSAKGAIFGTGDMGIANTTPSSAIAAVFTNEPAAMVTGRGTGIDDRALLKKIEVIEESIKVNRPDAKDPIDVLSKVGGAEIAGIAGLILGAASKRVPVVVDGMISTAGALVAYELNRDSADYMFSAHKSIEAGQIIMLNRIGLRPIVDLEMRLGEGTGGAIAISIIEGAMKIYNEMATFKDAGVSEKGE
ncbi:MAG: nicotinate-nucleotide--dimethylbenzimidazole phosphoribosyltransferase [Nitrospirota bacterium]|nr:nicotinate-nucleotide--dimethylbenzimidazole phosphoribosyltransferase [Nitrospirota bacterium]